MNERDGPKTAAQSMDATAQRRDQGGVRSMAKEKEGMEGRRDQNDEVRKETVMKREGNKEEEKKKDRR